MYNKWYDDELDFIKNNYKNMSVKHLSQNVNHSITSIQSKLKNLGLVKMWSNEEDEILKKYYTIEKEIKNFIHLLPNRTKSSILNRTTILKLKKQKTSYKDKINKYKIDHNFFEIYNNINSYWSGFIAADGHVDRKTGRIGIKLSEKDLNHLKKLKKDTKTETQISVFERNTFNKMRKYCNLYLYSKKMKSDIEKNFNIMTNKTFDLKPPTNIINFDHKLSYICGLIDGDGYITISNNRIVIGILGTFDVLSWIKNEINNIIDIKKISILKKGNIFQLKITGYERLKKLYTEVDKLQIPILDRKWNIIKNN